MPTENQALPVGALMRPIEPLQPEDSLQTAAERMRDTGVAAMPVAVGSRFVGLISEADMMRALIEGGSHRLPVARFIRRGGVTIAPYATPADALRAFHETGVGFLVVVDNAGSAVGILTPADLYPKRQGGYRPRFVGGMATPFGVYLTSGAASGGVGGRALFLTGMFLFSLFFVGSYGALAVVYWLPLADSLAPTVFNALSLIFFLALLRSMPISGFHAAEHMTVHAIERGEELVPEVVERMPRVHPRCGTNIAVGASIFLGLFMLEWTPYPELRLMVAAFATLIFWRPVGSVVQFFITTRPPNAEQVKSGIKAGRELLRRSQAAPFSVPSVGRRLLQSGLFHIMGGAAAANLILYGAFEVLRVPEVWRVI